MERRCVAGKPLPSSLPRFGGIDRLEAMILNCPECGDAGACSFQREPIGNGALPHCRESYALVEALEQLPPALQILDPGHPKPGNPFGLAPLR
jgi:hypothetical protein